MSWYRITLDEAHSIKDRACSTAQAVFKLTSRYKWCAHRPRNLSADALRYLKALSDKCLLVSGPILMRALARTRTPR